MIKSRYIDVEPMTQGIERKIHTQILFPTNKVHWRVKFNIPLNADSVNGINVFVTSIKNLPVKSNIRYISTTNEIEIEPLEDYNINETYILHITTKVQSRGGQHLKEPIEIQFVVKH